jgi:hypothetical protein
MLYPDEKPGKPVSWEEEWRRVGIRRGWPDWRIDAWIAIERLKRAGERAAQGQGKKRRR